MSNRNFNQSPPTDPQQGNQPKGGMPSGIVNFLIISFILTLAINAFLASTLGDNKIQVEYSQFINLIERSSVNQVQIEEEQVIFTLTADTDAYQAANERTGKPQLYCTGRVEDPGLTDRLIAYDIDFYKPIVKSSPFLEFMSTWVFPFIFFYIIYFFISSILRVKRAQQGGSFGGMGGMMNVGKSKAKMYSLEENTGVTFDDVAGQDEAKESLTEMVDFLHHPEKYNQIGAKQPKGALLVGPPGTGKTLLAKAVAGEAKVAFFSLSGSEFVEMFVGVGASRVRDLFAQANTHAPCIIFIDEIDAIGKSRDNQMGSNDEREQTLNQLLSEMDGFDSSKGIIVLAATNRPEVLDKALLRPGRFDRRVIVEKPDLPGREAILHVHAARVQTDHQVNLKEIALATSGATGADLANMVNEAALRAVRMNRAEVTQEDLLESVETIIAGKEKKDRIMNQKEKQMVAYHEVGHALASALQKDAQPVQKITIVPRTMGALGYTMQMPEEERYLMTESELLAQITTLLAGRAAEEIIFSEASTGASNDIERATKMARSMVTQYGMSKEFDMMGLESVQNQYLDGRAALTCSEATGSAIDQEVRKIIKDCHQKALKLLKENKEALHEISSYLLEKETITGKQFMELLSNHRDTKES